MVYRFDGSESASGTAPADADLFLMHDDSATDSGNPKDKIADCTAAQLAAYVATKIGVGGTNNMDATIDPTAGDDSDDGYEIGSMWYNQTTDTLWIAESVGVGSASWQNVSGAVTEKALDDLWQAAATPTLATNDKFPFADVSGTDTLGTATAPDICSTGGALLKDGTTDLTGDLVINERADHADTPTAGKGQLWVRNDTPNVLVFTDDAGTDTVLGSGSVTEKAIEDIVEGLTPAAPATADEFVFRDVSGTDALGCSTAQQIVEQGNSDLGIVPQNRISTTTDPGANDDGAGTNGINHLVNDLWTNTTDDTSWICVDTTTSAAVWKPIALTKTGTAAPAVAPDFVGQVFLDTTNENIYIGIDTVNAADFLQVNGGGGGTDVSLLSVEKNTAGTINKGQVVYVAGYDTDKPTVELADADDATALPPIGVANASITDSAAGDVVMSGIIDGMDTSAFTAGDNVYLDTTAGALTATRPDEEFVYRIGQVIYSHASNGVLRVNIERVKGRYWIFVNQEGKIQAGANLDNWFISPATGTVESIELSLAAFMSGSDGSNYWSFDIQNVSESDRPILAAPYDMTSDPTWKTWFSLGALNGTAANLEVTQGDIINLEVSKTGSPASLSGKSILIRMKVKPAN